MFENKKMKIAEIDSIGQGLLILKNAVDKNGGANAKLSYKVARFNQKIGNVLTTVNEQKNELIKKHGKEDKKGNISIDPKDEKAQKLFLKEFTDLLQVEEDVDVLSEKISISEFGELNVPIEVFERLSDFIDD